MGVVVLRRYIDILTIIINFPYSTCISSFFGSSIPNSLFIFKMFFRSCFCYVFTIYNVRVSWQRQLNVIRYLARGSLGIREVSARDSRARAVDARSMFLIMDSYN